jgi:hypothetical protein
MERVLLKVSHPSAFIAWFFTLSTYTLKLLIFLWIRSHHENSENGVIPSITLSKSSLEKKITKYK